MKSYVSLFVSLSNGKQAVSVWGQMERDIANDMYVDVPSY